MCRNLSPEFWGGRGSSIDFGESLQIAENPFKIQSPKMGSKVKKLSVKSLIKISTKSYDQRVQSSNNL